MGVSGLLPQLKEIQEPISLGKLRHKRVAIDSYAWLHKGAFSCSWELAQDQYTQKYLGFFKKRIALLRNFQIEPYFVFDGDNFGSKQSTETERAQIRKKNKEKGMKCLQKGDKKGAGGYFSVCVDITPSMAKVVIEYLKSESISYVVAPYEADAQMVYLEKQGLVDAIISEDSDLLIFGAKVLLTKLNEYGECIEIKRENFKKCRNIPIGLMSDSQLRIVACLSGCDYTNGIPGVGIITSFKLVKRIPSMKRCLMSLRLEGKKIPKEFEDEYNRADLSFQYQRVFDPVNKKITTLNEISELDKNNELLEESIGQLLDNDIHYQISIGEIDPISKKPLISREIALGLATKFQTMPVSLSTLKRRKSKTLPIQLQLNSTNTPLKTQSLPLKVSKQVTSIHKGINTFFSNRSNQSKRSITLSTSKVDPPLSPTSKRRKFFENHTIKPQVSSRFFADIKSKPNSVQFTVDKNIPLFVHESQSEGELTDVDLDKISDDDDDNNDESPQTTKTSPIEYNDENIDYTEDGINVSLDEDLDSDLDSNEEDLPNTQRILDDLKPLSYDEVVTTTTTTMTPISLNKQDIRTGLFERYGFRNEENKLNTVSKSYRDRSEQHIVKRVPLKSLRNIDNKPRVIKDTTLVKNKRSFSRNLTLDSFIYRS